MKRMLRLRRLLDMVKVVGTKTPVESSRPRSRRYWRTFAYLCADPRQCRLSHWRAGARDRMKTWTGSLARGSSRTVTRTRKATSKGSPAPDTLLGGCARGLTSMKTRSCAVSLRFGNNSGMKSPKYLRHTGQAMVAGCFLELMRDAFGFSRLKVDARFSTKRCTFPPSEPKKFQVAFDPGKAHQPLCPRPADTNSAPT